MDRFNHIIKKVPYHPLSLSFLDFWFLKYEVALPIYLKNSLSFPPSLPGMRIRNVFSSDPDPHPCSLPSLHPHFPSYQPSLPSFNSIHLVDNVKAHSNKCTLIHGCIKFPTTVYPSLSPFLKSWFSLGVEAEIPTQRKHPKKCALLGFFWILKEIVLFYAFYHYFLKKKKIEKCVCCFH